MTYEDWGFDYISPPIPVAVLKTNMADFVCRYLSDHDTLNGIDKDISATELGELLDGGISVVLNWESSGQMPSEEQGIADAKAAQAEAESLGVGSAVIYFSADFNPSGQEAAIVAYMTGVVSVLGVARAGIYGGLGAVQAALDAHVASHAWQTFAWSNGVWDARAMIQQYQNAVLVNGREVDRDRTTVKEYGQIKPPVVTPPPVESQEKEMWHVRVTFADKSVKTYLAGIGGKPVHIASNVDEDAAVKTFGDPVDITFAQYQAFGGTDVS